LGAAFYGKFIFPLLIDKRTAMEQEQLMQADYLDIIYDNRNKMYGSYELRRNYNRRTAKAILLLLGCVAALSSFTLVGKKAPMERTVVFDRDTRLSEVHIQPRVVPPVPKQPATPPPATQQVRTTQMTPPRITRDIDADKPLPTVTTLNNSTPGPVTASGAAGTASTIGNGKDNVAQPVIVAATPKPPVRWAAKMPEFAGDMYSYISKVLRYPDAARESGIEGQVLIEFVVNEDGSVSDIKVVRGIGGGCDEEAVRMVHGMPHWKPGEQNGIPVKVVFALPVKFELK
jgi:periplasmic protein TonB